MPAEWEMFEEIVVWNAECRRKREKKKMSSVFGEVLRGQKKLMRGITLINEKQELKCLNR